MCGGTHFTAIGVISETEVEVGRGGGRRDGQRKGGREARRERFAREDLCGDLILIDSRINTGAALLILGRLLSLSNLHTHTVLFILHPFCFAHRRT